MDDDDDDDDAMIWRALCGWSKRCEYAILTR